MLEREIALSLAEGIVQSAKQAGALKIVSAKVAVGAVRVLDECQFLAEMDQALAGTVADGAEIELVRPAARMRCCACGHEYEFVIGDPATYDCPACGHAKHDLVGGMEIDLLDVQGMVPGMSLADKLAKAVEDKLGPVEKPANE